MKSILVSMALLFLLDPLPAGAQQRPFRRPGQSPNSKSKTGSSTLERAGLDVGQKLPPLTIHSENGEKFPLNKIKGKYTVLVFGCLT